MCAHEHYLLMLGHILVNCMVLSEIYIASQPATYKWSK